MTFELMSETLDVIRSGIHRFAGLIDRLREEVDWQLPAAMDGPTSCFHGGAFFSATGEEFDHLERRHQIIHADVLDAWFPSAPGVLEALAKHLPWLISTSPPTDAAGLPRVIGREREVDPTSILPGSGTSSLIFLALREWFRPGSRVLLLEPCYGEYAHVLEAIIGCRTERLPLHRSEGYTLEPERLAERLSAPYDLVVLVNPNNPTGCHLPGARLAEIIQAAPSSTRFWIDETYVDFAGANQSLERFASKSRNTVFLVRNQLAASAVMLAGHR